MNQRQKNTLGLLYESGGPLVLKVFASLCVIGGLIGWVIRANNEPSNSFSGTAPLIVTVGVITLALLRHGQSRWAASTLVWGLLFAISFGAYTGAGLQNASWIVMPICIMLIGWMLGSRAAVVLSIATTLVVVALFGLHVTGHVFRPPSGPLIFGMVIVLLSIVAASIGSVTASVYQAQLGQLRTLHDQLTQDISKSKEYEKTLEHVAHFDVLTSLPNRVLLADRLQQAMAQAQRRSQQLAVAFLDLDGFKTINDTHGHAAGDQFLIALADRMKQALREGDTLARIGGDEFVAVLIDLDGLASCEPILSRLLGAASAPVLLGELVLQASASVGVTFYPQPQDFDADQLLRQADQAMYQAKMAGKNRYYVFDAEKDSTARGHLESLERIRVALENDEFVLHYQPKVNMRTGKVIGAEALIRWQHPEKGLLAPAAFLPVMEDHPLAVNVGEWVIDAALTQVEQWRVAGLDMPVSVNVGARQLQHGDFVERLTFILSRHPQVAPASLEIEVLETSALADMVLVSQVIEDCAQIGVKFALDDFGTGYSSLTYLKRLRVHMLKIDQSFVRDMLEDQDDLAILEGVIGLAAAFRRQVIAEGVETAAHGTALLHLGCDLAQGYGIARPMPGAELPSWTTAWRPDDAWSELPWLGHLEHSSDL